ncbi:protein TolQ [Paralimibaculum aggregatum]|nr:protein TolQ [Limibaculum sp. NKW23]
MFWRATPIVQAVMLLLLAASFWSWTIILSKALALGRLTRQTRAFEANFWSGQSLDELFDRVGARPRTPIERVFVAGMREWRRSFLPNGSILAGTQARLDRAMAVAIAREGERVQSRLAFLATVGAVSPFVGLFATVWGIKHSFESIAIAQNTNLAVVAPGIAEALLATALGLLAAIPATVGYNRLGAMAEGVSASLENFADEFSTLLAREIDRSQTPMAQPAAMGMH